MFWSRFDSLMEQLVTPDEVHKEYKVFKDVNIKEVISNDAEVKAFKQEFYNISNEYHDYLINELVSNYATTSDFTSSFLQDGQIMTSAFSSVVFFLNKGIIAISHLLLQM